jgi:hypothetical protein
VHDNLSLVDYLQFGLLMGFAPGTYPRAAWLNRILAPCYLMLGERLAAQRALHALRESCPAITVAQVVAAMPKGVTSHRLVIADGLSSLGLPP